MLDLSAAFDTVDHDILIDRLRQSFDVQGLALTWIESFLRDRTQSVSIAGDQSAGSTLTCGVYYITLHYMRKFIVRVHTKTKSTERALHSQ